eukprot:g4880.t1
MRASDGAASSKRGRGFPKRKRSSADFSMKAKQGWKRHKRELQQKATKGDAVLVSIAPRTFEDQMLHGQVHGVTKKERWSFSKDAKAQLISATEAYARWLLHTTAACAAAREKDGGGRASRVGEDNDSCRDVTLEDITLAEEILREVPHAEDILVQPKSSRGVSAAFVHIEANGNANRVINGFLLEPPDAPLDL